MKKKRIIARLDVKGPNVIKGIHLEGLRVVGDPQQLAKRYYDQGADELLYMDAVASLYGRNNLVEVVERAASELFVPLTVGGGIRSTEDIHTLLRAGADKIAINSAAVRNPTLITEAAEVFGSQCVVISIEAKQKGAGSWEVYLDCGRERTELDVMQWAEQAVALGAGELIVTSIDQEGTKKGFDIELSAEVTKRVSVPVVAHGGAGSCEHVLSCLRESCSDGVAIASILHYELHGIDEVKQLCAENEVLVRR